MRSVLFGNDEICYSLERKKVKNINLRIKQSGEVYVSAPLFVCTERIDSFVLQNAPKILAAKKRFEAAKAAAPQFVSGDSVSVLGKEYALCVCEGSAFSFSFCQGELHMTVKNSAEFENRKCAYEKVLHAEAKRTFPELSKNAIPHLPIIAKPCLRLKFAK